MRALGRKKHNFFFGDALPKSNARAHLKQREKLSGLSAETIKAKYITLPLNKSVAI